MPLHTLRLDLNITHNLKLIHFETCTKKVSTAKAYSNNYRIIIGFILCTVSYGMRISILEQFSQEYVNISHENNMSSM